MKVLVAAFNQEKALVGAFSVIVKTDCGTDWSFYSTTIGRQRCRAPPSTATINIHKRIIHQQFSIPRPVLMASIIYITLPRYCHGRPQRKEKYLWMWGKRLFFNLREGSGGVEANCNYISVEKNCKWSERIPGEKQWWQKCLKINLTKASFDFTSFFHF